MVDSLNEVSAELIIGIVAAIVSIFAAVASFIQAKRRMYLDVIVKRRQESVEERRQTLRELYYYTDRNLIEELTEDSGAAHTLKLLEIKSRFDYRFIDMFYPGSDLQILVNTLIDSTIALIKEKTAQNENDEFSFPKEYDIMRTECLRKVKLYNYASWEFLQTQSFGLTKKWGKGVL